MNINEKLGFISETMSDGYYFFQMRGFFEHIENDTNSDDPVNAQSAEKILDMMDKFYKLCNYVRRNS